MGRNRRVRHSGSVPSSRMTEMERALPMTCLLVRMQLVASDDHAGASGSLG